MRYVETGKLEKYPVTLDSTKQPKQIDWADDNDDNSIVRRMRGIYQLNGDRLTICTALEGQRPSELTTRKGDKRLLIVFKRVVKTP